MDRVFPERVELAGKSPSRDSSGQAAGFECTMSCSANLEIMITIIHWGAFQDEGMNCALVKESAARPPAESDKGKTGN